MPKLHQLAATAAASALLTFAAPAVAAPVTVNLRVEGSGQTIYEAPITTDAKVINMDGSHPCNGTTDNGTTSTTPGPTMTGALDDASISAPFPWNGSWYESTDGSFKDYFINSIGSDANTPGPTYTPYWGYFLNWVTSSVGGCQQKVAQGDDVLFAYGDFGEPLLDLTAPARAATGESFTVTVKQHDGNNDPATPAAGATVEGHTTDAQGSATLSYSDPGIHRFKATRSGSIRSDAASVCVYAPGSGDCGTGPASQDTSTGTAPSEAPVLPAPPPRDTTPPTVSITSIVNGKTYSRGPRVLTGDVADDGGIAQVFLRLRRLGGGQASRAMCRWYSGKREVFTHRVVACSNSRFFRIGTERHWSYLLPARLGSGRFVLEVKALDKAYNAGRASVGFKVR